MCARARIIHHVDFGVQLVCKMREGQVVSKRTDTSHSLFLRILAITTQRRTFKELVCVLNVTLTSRFFKHTSHK